MKDKLDGMLQGLPGENVPPQLAASVRRAVHRRHSRRLAVRRGGGAVLGALGLWLLWPAAAWLSSSDLYASSTPWLVGGLGYLNDESLAMLNRLWTGAASLQAAIGSSVAASILLGALLVCCAIFLAIDTAKWQAVPRPERPASGPTMAPSGLHL